MKREETIQLMNRKGSEKAPFLFVIDYSMNNCRILHPQEAFQKNVWFNFNGVQNYPHEQNYKPVSINGIKPVSFSEYQKAFNLIQQEIAQGNSYLVNLTFPTPIQATGTLKNIFLSTKAPFKLMYDNLFVVFSPESFVKITDGTIATFPMKGTIDASLPRATAQILANKKEMAEHATVVDLLRNDLSIVAQNVNVEKYRYTEEIISNNKRLLQVSSAITGVLPPDYCSHLGDIIFAMLPAGSVTGAPKKKTLHIISQVENYERGFYTGVAGYFDGKNLNSCVLIRFIENQNGQLIYKSGGGITSQSKAEDEYQELIDKIYVPIG